MGAKTQWDEKVITGMRRCGKSYLLFNLFTKALQEAGVEERQIVKINLEDRCNKGFLHSKPLLYRLILGALLRISNSDVRGKYALYNMQGLEVAFGALEGVETRIKAIAFPAGVYLLRLTAENRAQKTFTVVKH